MQTIILLFMKKVRIIFDSIEPVSLILLGSAYVKKQSAVAGEPEGLRQQVETKEKSERDGPSSLKRQKLVWNRMMNHQGAKRKRS